MTQHVNDLPPDRADKLRRMKEIKAEQEALETEYDNLRDELMPELNEPVFIIGDDGEKYRVSKVQGSMPVWHYENLDKLTPEQREAITEVKISGAKFKQEIQAGRLDPEVALDLVSYRPKRAYPAFEPVE